MHFIYYINRSIATKVDSTYLGYWPTAHSVYVLWRELGSNSLRLGHRADAFPLHHTCRQMIDRYKYECMLNLCYPTIFVVDSRIILLYIYILFNFILLFLHKQCPTVKILATPLPNPNCIYTYLWRDFANMCSLREIII